MSLSSISVISVLAHTIISQYFNDSRCIFILSDDHFSYQGAIPQLQLSITNDSINADLLFKSFGCQSIIISTNNPAPVFVQFEREIRHHAERFNGRNFLILPSDILNLKSTYHEIFNAQELEFVSDFLVVMPVFDNITDDLSMTGEEIDVQFELRTHQYVGISGGDQQFVIDQWFSINRSFLHGNNLYPDKLYNQQGRPLRMATFDYAPYVVIGDDPDELHGSELRTAATFAKFHNMTPVLVVNTDDFWGEIFANYSGTGLLGNLMEDRADVAFVVGTWPYCFEFLDFSKSVISAEIRCIVPAPKLLSGWFTPLFAFSSTVWIYIALVFILGFVVYVIMTWCYGGNSFGDISLLKLIRRGAFVFSKLFLVQSVNDDEIPTQRSGKFLIALFFIFCLFWSNTYDSGFASVMTLPRYEKAIDTVQDLADSGLHWGAPQYAWITAIRDLTEEKFITVVKNFQAHPDPILRQLSFSGKFGYGVERLPADNFAIGSYVKEDVISNFHLMQEDLYKMNLIMMLKKSSILLPYLNRFILRVYEAGLIPKWQNIAANKFMDVKIQRAMAYYNRHPHNKDSVVVKLKLDHVQGAFAALIIGYVVSLIALALELLAWNNRAQKQSQLH